MARVIQESLLQGIENAIHYSGYDLSSLKIEKHGDGRVYIEFVAQALPREIKMDVSEMIGEQ